MEEKQDYDSRPDTYEHILQVQRFLSLAIKDLLERQLEHDQSKLTSPEVEYFDKYTPLLAGITYGSEEYKKCLADMKPAIDHHQARNRHHPEYHKEGIRDMNLIDLLEMLCDWKAATMRHNDGNILKSLDHNEKRFNFSPELKAILLNTIKYLGLDKK